MNPVFRFFVLALCGALLLGSCESDEPEESNESAEREAEALVSEGLQSVLDRIETDPSLSTLAESFQQTELDSILAFGGPLTLFAPTNAAFSDLEESIGNLSSANQRHVLEYHVIETRIRTPDIPGEMQITTLYGEDLLLHPEHNGLSIIDAGGNRARVVTPNIDTPNGVVHIIDRVLVNSP